MSYFRTILAAMLLSGVCGASQAATLRPAAVETFFVMPGEAAVLRWTAEPAPRGPLEYVIRDYEERQVATGEATIGEQGVEARVTLPAGFYELSFPATGQRFGIAAVARGESDPFFAIDTAMSWLVSDNGVREGLIAGLARSGIGMARERLAWGHINPARGEWRWDGDRRYDRIRQSYAQAGVALLEMCHDAPAWTGRVGKYPSDLVATAEAWRAIAARWQPTWGALEVWNEPDISFGDNLPADQYVALVRALAGVLPRGADAPAFVGGVVAHYNRAFLDTAAANGLLDLIGPFSFHTYGRAEEMETQVGKYREWLAAHGRPAAPLWITECGRPWKKGPDRPPRDEDAVSALDIVMKAVEAKACGIERYFAFVYPFYEERDSNFGMMGREATPLRSMAAYAQSAARLGGMRYVGDLCDCAPPVKRARVFAGERETVAVIYTGEVRADAKIKLGLKPLAVVGIDGRALALGADGTVPVPDGLSYVVLERGALEGRIDGETAAGRLLETSRSADRARRAVSPVVLRYEFDKAAVSATSEGYRLASERPAELPLRLRIFNLAETPETVRLTLGFSRAGPAVQGEAERSIEVPARSAVDATWRLNLAEAFAADNQFDVIVRVECRVPTAPLVLHFTGEGTLAQQLQHFSAPVRLPIGERARWAPAIAGGGEAKLETTAEGHWRLTAKFAPGDRWVFPRFTLPEDVRLESLDGVVIRARCTRPGTVRLFLWEDGGVGYLTAGSLVPADGQWHTAHVRFADLSPSSANTRDPNGRLDLDQVRAMSIGVNSEEAENTLEVSDLYLVGVRQ